MSMKELLSDLVYVPIGLVTVGPRRLPELVEQGRLQVGNARIMGEMATRVGSAKLTEQVAGATTEVHAALVRLGLVPPDDPAAPTGHAGAGATHHVTVEADPTPRPAMSVVPEMSDLAIVEYDSLAASQVVPRLAALDPDELDAVRRYEIDHRGRKTILGRIAQLQD
ncbi:MAG: hypothetical protein JST73_03510 [Actinobacteria bacterium]|nr:hypothetical protein [Actinomycetota bacterium]